MRFGSRLKSGGSPLITGQIVSQICIFARNVVITRALTSHDYGIAATFGVTIALLQTTSEIGVSQFLIQAADGDTVRLQRTSHGIRALQGFAVSAVLFLLSPVMSELFNVPEARWTYALLALAPILNGMVHLDTIRFQRESNFGPDMIVRAGSQLCSLIAVCLLVPVLDDYNLALAGIIGMPLSALFISHLVAERSYRVAVEPIYVRRVLHYGLPLLANGILLACVSQGDRLLLGSAETIHQFLIDHIGATWQSTHALGKVDLAVYAVALSLAMIPGQFVRATLGTLLFPALCRLRSRRAEFCELCRDASTLLTVLGAALASGLILAGTDVTVLVFSDKYRGVAPFIGLLGVMQAINILRASPVTISLATAHTRLPLIANIARTFGLIGVLFAVLYGVDLYWIALSGTVAEVLSLTVSLFFIHRWAQIPFRAALPSIFVLLTSISGAFALDFLTQGRSSLASLLLALIYCAAIPILTWAAFPRILGTMRYLMSERCAT